MDASGNLYISDVGNNRVRKVFSDGTIKTVAGNGSSGYAGDGGPATSAGLNSPAGIAVDASGNLYIADVGNNRVRKVFSDGTIKTVAGNGSSGYAGDGGVGAPTAVAMAPSGNLILADPENNVIREVLSTGAVRVIAGTGETGFSGDGGPAIMAKLNHPSHIALDASGAIYISDSDNVCIRKIDARGYITTIAGIGEVGFSGDGGPAVAARLNRPAGIAIDSVGNIYVADAGNNRVRQISLTGIISTTMDGLKNPTDLSFDRWGSLYVAELNNHQIRKLTPIVVDGR
ncbi:MAG: hypothetical protein LAQ69_46030 [Acidobacteriia bacterium]|nr:hypothetical protein [Terriglobia bacterium]